MKKNCFLIIVLIFLSSCGTKDDTKDMEMPTITDTNLSVCPYDCQTFHKGDTISVIYRFNDNEMLGYYNIEIHNNFDHHTHSTSAKDCDLDAVKEPIKPWVYNKDFDIPRHTQSFVSNVQIAIPNNIDEGDYHFMIRLTDMAGWQQLKSVSIKIID